MENTLRTTADDQKQDAREGDIHPKGVIEQFRDLKVGKTDGVHVVTTDQQCPQNNDELVASYFDNNQNCTSICVSNNICEMTDDGEEKLSESSSASIAYSYGQYGEVADLRDVEEVSIEPSSDSDNEMREEQSNITLIEVNDDDLKSFNIDASFYDLPNAIQAVKLKSFRGEPATRFDKLTVGKSVDKEKCKSLPEVDMPAKRPIELDYACFWRLSDELQCGFKILMALMADSNKGANTTFMHSPENDEMINWRRYNQKISKPMWLWKVHENFEKEKYSSITEFVSDVRTMLENCYKFNGTDHHKSKKGQKLETVLEQKLALLSRDLRNKTTLEVTSGSLSDVNLFSGARRRRTIMQHDSSALMNRLRFQEKEKEREERRNQWVERQREKEQFEIDLVNWEDEILPPDMKQLLESLWEIPCIGQFLFLCSSALNVGEINQYELERAFLLPRESRTLQLVMTSLLSTPYQRTKLHRHPLMPYKVWEERLRVRVRLWYKALEGCDRDVEKTVIKTGLVEQFFRVVGLKSPLENKRYHELSVYRRVWLLKGLCDNCVETQESLRDAIEAQSSTDYHAYELGFDEEGAQYLYFPQFCDTDIRIYRQIPLSWPKMKPVVASRGRSFQSRGRFKKKSQSNSKYLQERAAIQDDSTNSSSADSTSDENDSQGTNSCDGSLCSTLRRSTRNQRLHSAHSAMVNIEGSSQGSSLDENYHQQITRLTRRSSKLIGNQEEFDALLNISLDESSIPTEKKPCISTSSLRRSSRNLKNSPRGTAPPANSRKRKFAKIDEKISCKDRRLSTRLLSRHSSLPGSEKADVRNGITEKNRGRPSRRRKSLKAGRLVEKIDEIAKFCTKNKDEKRISTDEEDLTDQQMYTTGKLKYAASSDSEIRTELEHGEDKENNELGESSHENENSKDCLEGSPSNKKAKLEKFGEEGQPIQSDAEGISDVNEGHKSSLFKNEMAVKEESDIVIKEEAEDENLPDPKMFRLVARNIEELREMCKKLDQKTEDKDLKMKSCVTHLSGRCRRLLADLEPWESRFVQCHRRSKAKMKREQMSYVEEPETGWDSSHSSDEEKDVSQKMDDDELPGEPPIKEEDIILEEGEGILNLRGGARKRRFAPKVEVLSETTENNAAAEVESEINSDRKDCIAASSSEKEPEEIVNSGVLIRKDGRTYLLSSAGGREVSQAVLQQLALQLTSKSSPLCKQKNFPAQKIRPPAESTVKTVATSANSSEAPEDVDLDLPMTSRQAEKTASLNSVILPRNDVPENHGIFNSLTSTRRVSSSYANNVTVKALLESRLKQGGTDHDEGNNGKLQANPIKCQYESPKALLTASRVLESSFVSADVSSLSSNVLQSKKVPLDHASLVGTSQCLKKSYSAFKPSLSSIKNTQLQRSLSAKGSVVMSRNTDQKCGSSSFHGNNKQIANFSQASMAQLLTAQVATSQRSASAALKTTKVVSGVPVSLTSMSQISFVPADSLLTCKQGSKFVLVSPTKSPTIKQLIGNQVVLLSPPTGLSNLLNQCNQGSSSVKNVVPENGKDIGLPEKRKEIEQQVQCVQKMDERLNLDEIVKTVVSSVPPVLPTMQMMVGHPGTLPRTTSKPVTITSPAIQRPITAAVCSTSRDDVASKSLSSQSTAWKSEANQVLVIASDCRGNAIPQKGATSLLGCSNAVALELPSLQLGPNKTNFDPAVNNEVNNVIIVSTQSLVNHSSVPISAASLHTYAASDFVSDDKGELDETTEKCVSVSSFVCPDILSPLPRAKTKELANLVALGKSNVASSTAKVQLLQPLSKSYVPTSQFCDSLKVRDSHRHQFIVQNDQLILPNNCDEPLRTVRPAGFHLAKEQFVNQKDLNIAGSFMKNAQVTLMGQPINVKLAQIPVRKPLNIVKMPVSSVSASVVQLSMHNEQSGASSMANEQPTNSILNNPNAEVTLCEPATSIAVSCDGLPMNIVGNRQPMKVAINRQPINVAINRPTTNVAINKHPTNDLMKQSTYVTLKKPSVGVALGRQPVGIAFNKQPVGIALNKQPVGIALNKQPVGIALNKQPVGVALHRQPVGLINRLPGGISLNRHSFNNSQMRLPTNLPKQPTKEALCLQSDGVELQPEPVPMSTLTAKVSLTTHPSSSCLTTHSSSSCLKMHPSSSCLTTQPSSACLTTQPSSGFLTIQPSSGCLTIQPSSGCLTIQPSSACLTTQPSGACLITQPSGACPTSQSASTCPTSQSANTCPTSQSANTCPTSQSAGSCPTSQSASSCPTSQSVNICGVGQISQGTHSNSSPSLLHNWGDHEIFAKVSTAPASEISSFTSTHKNYSKGKYSMELGNNVKSLSSTALSSPNSLFLSSHANLKPVADIGMKNLHTRPTSELEQIAIKALTSGFLSGASNNTNSVAIECHPSSDVTSSIPQDSDNQPKFSSCGSFVINKSHMMQPATSLGQTSLQPTNLSHSISQPTGLGSTTSSNASVNQASAMDYSGNPVSMKLATPVIVQVRLANGQVVVLKLSVPSGMSIQQVLQSPQIQKQLTAAQANLVGKQ